MDQSTPSRYRAAFAFGNIAKPFTWRWMSLLTWRACHAPTAKQVGLAIDRLRREWRERWGEPMDGWVMEMHKSGVPHFHGFHTNESAFGRALAEGQTETIRRRRRKTIIARGSAERWLVGTWIASTGQLGDEMVLAFNRRGIIEQLRHPDAAGRYIAKEAAKREQKKLPACYAEGLGRWWWLAPHLKGTRKRRVHLDLSKWPYPHPLSHVWDAAAIECCIIEPPPKPKGTRIYVLRADPPPLPAPPPVHRQPVFRGI